MESNTADQPSETQEEMQLELEIVNKVLSIDAANIETLDEFSFTFENFKNIPDDAS